MGGFEGGDEGGFWDEDELLKSIVGVSKKEHKPSIVNKDGLYSIKAHAKVNIFLKITGHKNGYHTLLSRFVRVDDLYDTIELVPCVCDAFSIEGCDGVPTKSNTIYKAYDALIEYTEEAEIVDFFKAHKVVVTKRIPSQAGLGGGSSDAAAFMHLLKEVCNLVLSTKELAQIGSTIGADLPFFIYNYPSANVSGFGEVVELFEEEALKLKLYTPNIACDTTVVYKTFKENLLESIEVSSFMGWEKLASKELLERIKNPVQLNDLYAASLMAYPKLNEEQKEGWFFSGSGSSYFSLEG